MTSSFITSFVLHVVFLFLLCTEYCSLKVPQDNNLEVEVACIGDFKKEIGGNGLGEQEVAQPMESTETVNKESEILPDDPPQLAETKAETKAASVPTTPEKNITDINPDNTPGEVIPTVEKTKKELKKLDKPSDKVDRPPKKKKNAIIDLLAEEKKVNSDFDELLSSLDENSKLIRKKHSASSKVKGEGGGGGGTALSGSDYEIIKKQVMPYWIVPTGIKDYEKYIVRLRVKVHENGQISRSDIAVEDNIRYNADRLYRVSVDSAKRALLMASPLKIPKNKIRNVKNFVIVFDPRDAL